MASVLHIKIPVWEQHGKAARMLRPLQLQSLSNSELNHVTITGYPLSLNLAPLHAQSNYRVYFPE